MRTYSGFLILEDLLNSVPASSPNLVNFLYDITNPPINVIENDCGTTVGKVVSLDFSLQGRTELATGLALTQTRITTILMGGIYIIAIRDTQNCTSVGGICQKCYASTFIDMAVPDVGAVIRIPPEYNYQSDVIISDGMTTVYTLTEDAANYEKLIFYYSGSIHPTGYSVTGSTLTLSVVPVSGTYMLFKFYKTTSQPFMGYLSDSYTGALLGMKSLQTQGINVKPGLIQAQLTETKIAMAQAELQTLFPVISINYIHYLDTIKDPLEKSLYISALYGIYGNVTT